MRAQQQKACNFLLPYKSKSYYNRKKNTCMLGIILSTHLRTCDIPKSPEEFKLNPTKPEKIGKTTTEHMHTLLQKRNYWRHAPGSGAWHIPGAQ